MPEYPYHDLALTFRILCEGGETFPLTLTRSCEKEAQEWIERDDMLLTGNWLCYKNGERSSYPPMIAYWLEKTEDAHNIVSPQCWKVCHISFTTLEDMVERQVAYCKREYIKRTEEGTWGEGSTLEGWTEMMVDAVKELWGLETPETLERKKRQEEFEQKYSRKYMSRKRYAARAHAAKRYSQRWNNWLAGRGTLGQYDKWTFSEMLDFRGYGYYTDKEENLVVLPCFDDPTPKLDENGVEL